ncbi:mavicyanin-like [Telopea speciosissima]|uniref:mavicyanin-like n=1 Tax=Telopea speciosissima TaxID=54955 RepID=UPI001CC48030|nr:mavicyanin-like [Telopea speciosissima]
MGFVQRAMVMFFLVMASLEISLAAEYKVGESTGWTTLGNYNYTAWAESKTFRVGDIIIFEYHKERHNVLRVAEPNFQACNASSPLVTYMSGNDSILINKTGHHYFLCGIPGHCLSGQKVDIHIPNKSSIATAPFGSPAASPTPKSSAPYPSKGLLGKFGMPVLALSFCASVFVY